MSEQSYIACVLWGEQIVESDLFKCCECGKDVALDKRNVTVCKELEKICLMCASKKFSKLPDSEFGNYDGGRLTQVREGQLERFRNLYKKVN